MLTFSNPLTAQQARTASMLPLDGPDRLAGLRPGRAWELLRHQTALAGLAEYGLSCGDVDEVLNEACRLAVQGLEADLAAVLHLQEPGRTLWLRAGRGWQPGPLGGVSFRVGPTSAEGLALASNQPSAVSDTDAQPGFSASPLLAINGVRAFINAVIAGQHGQPNFGLMQVCSRAPRAFTADDTAFMRSFATLLATVINRIVLVAELRDTERQMELTLDAGKLGRWTFDLASGVASGSAQTMLIFGYAGHPSSWSYEHFLNQVVPEDRAAIVSTFRTAADGGGDWRFECRIQRPKTGQIRWIEAHGRASGGSGDTPPTHMLGLVADITARKSSETDLLRANTVLGTQVTERTRRLTEANAQLLAQNEQRERIEDGAMRSQKMEAVGQLAAGVARDFNNLLSGISASLDLIRVRAAQGRLSELDRYIEAAQGASIRGGALAHRLLAVSRRNAPNQRAADVNHLVASMEPLLRHRGAPAIRVRTRLTPRLATAWCDPNHLETAVLDLVSAACDAMPDGGELVIATANAAWPDDGGDCVSLSVTDCGAAPRSLPQSVGEAVSRAGGTLRLETVAAAGTTATIYLPCHQEARPPVPPTPPPPGSVVLVVEDEPTVRMVVCDVLSDLGYTVLDAPDARAGIAVAEAAPRLDLLITDFVLSGEMNGRQLAHQLRQMRPALKVLFMTGSADTQGPSGVAPVMAKPFTTEALTTRVQEAING